MRPRWLSVIIPLRRSRSGSTFGGQPLSLSRKLSVGDGQRAVRESWALFLSHHSDRYFRQRRERGVVRSGGFSLVFPDQSSQRTADAEKPGGEDDQRDPERERPEGRQQNAESEIVTAEPIGENKPRTD
jgi:hypothetical protein